MIKLIAVDLDDTLLNNKIEISKKNYETIKACQEKGINFTIATGRMYRAAYRYAKELDVDLPLITYQGALVKNLQGQEFFHKKIDKKLALEVVEYLKKQDMQLNVYLDDELLVEKIDDHGRYYQKITNVDLKLSEFPKDIKTDPTKMLLIGDSKKLDKIQEYMVKLYGQELTITKSKDSFLEIGHINAKKGIALKNLAESMGIKREEVLAIGDGMNDYDMIEYAGIGVVVDNGSSKVKKIADYITDTNENDGVAKAIEKFALSTL